MDQKIIVRVYGIWINHLEEILLSDERYGKHEFTKFPGGGLEFGEGPIDCLKREWKEELGVDINILEHFYTTDFFQASFSNEQNQILSIYYKIEPITFPKTRFTTKALKFNYEENIEIKFRFLSMNLLSENDVTLPIDKKVVAMLIAK
jgi:8-oxo-dGTP diphosphatase